MNEFNKRSPIRLPEYDYSQNGCYFVTAYTKEHQALFRNANNFDELSKYGLNVKMAI